MKAPAFVTHEDMHTLVFHVKGMAREMEKALGEIRAELGATRAELAATKDELRELKGLVVHNELDPRL